jgi:hypothetical protein
MRSLSALLKPKAKVRQDRPRWYGGINPVVRNPRFTEKELEFLRNAKK